MRPIEVLMHLRNAWLQEPQRELVLTVCHVCCDALLHDLDRLFIPVEGQHALRLDGSQVMGFTFTESTEKTCNLHAFWQEDVVCPR